MKTSLQNHIKFERKYIISPTHETCGSEYPSSLAPIPGLTQAESLETHAYIIYWFNCFVTKKENYWKKKNTRTRTHTHTTKTYNLKYEFRKTFEISSIGFCAFVLVVYFSAIICLLGQEVMDLCICS